MVERLQRLHFKYAFPQCSKPCKILHFPTGLVEQSERVAEEGEVDASMALAAQAEALKGEHDKLLATLTAPDRIMSVCEVCGVFINSTDNEQRRQAGLAHATGSAPPAPPPPTAVSRLAPLTPALCCPVLYVYACCWRRRQDADPPWSASCPLTLHIWHASALLLMQ